MRESEKAQSHFEKHIKQSDEQYAAWLRRGGVEPTDILMRENRGSALNEARESYIKAITEIRDHTIKVIVRDNNKRIRAIKREGAHLCLKICPPIALVFGLMAWYSFAQGRFFMGMVSITGSLAFLALLVLRVLFDRPRR